MLSMIKLCIANLRRKRLQSLLITLTILACATIFSIAIALLSIIDKPFEEMFTALNASHTTLDYDARLNSRDIPAFWEAQPEVASIHLFRIHYVEGRVGSSHSEAAYSLIIAERSEGEITQDRVKIIEGEEKTLPGERELWLPSAFAYNNHIQLGDTLEVPTPSGIETFTVSAIVVDPHYSSGLRNPVRVWAAPGTIEDYFLQDAATFTLGIRYHEYSERRELELWKAFEDYLGGGYNGLKLEYPSIVFMYTFLYNVIGIILIIFAAIILIVGLIIISFTISATILADYSTIGLLKSQGFSTFNIIASYTLQYGISALIGIPFGILAGIPGIQAIVVNMTRGLGLVASSLPYFTSGLITFLLVACCILASVVLASSKAAQIRPSEAIRYGAPEKKYAARDSIPFTALRHLPVELMLSLKEIFYQRKQFLFLIIGVLAASLVLSFSITCTSSLQEGLKDPQFTGWDNSELSITLLPGDMAVTPERLHQALQERDDVYTVIPLRPLVNSSFFLPKLGMHRNIVGYAYDGDMNQIGLPNLEGRNPVNENEISISYTLARELNKKAGETMEATIEGEAKRLLISGVFQGMNNGGYIFRMQAVQIQDTSLSMETMYQVKLKEPADPEKTISQMKETFGDTVHILNNEKMIANQFSSITYSMYLSMIIIGCIVTLVCFITLFNIITIHLLQMKKKYGIYKAFGMTSLEIRRSLLYMVLLAALIGTSLGIAAGYLLTPVIINPIFISQGIAKFNITVKGTHLLLILPLCMAITAISAWLPSGKIMRIHPRSLIIE